MRARIARAMDRNVRVGREHSAFAGEALNQVTDIPVPDPLLATQSRLWSTSVIYAESAPYVISAAYAMRGPLDVDRLRAAVVMLPTLHPGLTIRHEVVDGRLRMVAAPDATGRLETHRDGGVVKSSPAELVDECLRGWVWDLSQPPHLRAALYETDPTHSLLVIAVHHVATDAMGFDRFIADLLRLYNNPDEAGSLPGRSTGFTTVSARSRRRSAAPGSTGTASWPARCPAYGYRYRPDRRRTPCAKGCCSTTRSRSLSPRRRWTARSSVPPRAVR